MKLPEIVTIPHPLLRKKLEPVTEFNAELAELADAMIELTLQAEGVGLAANQIAIDKQIFVYGIDEPFELNGKTVAAVPFQAVVNPEVVVVDGQEEVHEEGCLSIPGLRGPVARPLTIRLKGQLLDGTRFERNINGYEARIVQHEVDHLNGRLFLDHITDPSKLYRVDED